MDECQALQDLNQFDREQVGGIKMQGKECGRVISVNIGEVGYNFLLVIPLFRQLFKTPGIVLWNYYSLSCSRYCIKQTRDCYFFPLSGIYMIPSGRCYTQLVVYFCPLLLTSIFVITLYVSSNFLQESKICINLFFVVGLHSQITLSSSYI